MAELEQTIEEKLITQLTQGKSQWTYRPDLNDENKLWDNIRQILERGNKEQLDELAYMLHQIKKVNGGNG